MGKRTPEAFDSSIQKSQLWLKDIQASAGLATPQQAYAVLRVVLHALRDCLPAPETAKLAAQLPLLMKGVFYDGWSHRARPLRLDRAAFYARIREELPPRGAPDPALAFRSVVRTLHDHISPAKLESLVYILPREIKALLLLAVGEIHQEEARGEHGRPYPADRVTGRRRTGAPSRGTPRPAGPRPPAPVPRQPAP